MQVRSVTSESHPSPDVDIKTRPHEGVLFEGQRLQDHAHVLTSVVQEECQMHSTSAPPSIAAQHPNIERHVANVQECA